MFAVRDDMPSASNDLRSFYLSNPYLPVPSTVGEERGEWDAEDAVMLPHPPF